MRGEKAMSLLDVCLAHAREVPTRPVREGVLVSSEGETQGVACACQRAAIPPATPTEGHRPVTPVLLSCHTMARPTLGETWQGLAALHGLTAVACA
jgi:hypothetical protein